MRMKEQGQDFVLEAEIIKGQADRLGERIKELAEILVHSYALVETDFAHKKPEEVANDFMLKSLAEFLDQSAEEVDWDLFQKNVEGVLAEFFINMDWKKYSNALDLNFFVAAKNRMNGKTVGVIQFIVSPEYEEHDVKAALYGVLPGMQNCGLEKMLMSSIFRLKPDTKRIFLHTRSTNQQVISQYKAWGFSEFGGKLQNWTDLEYLSENSDFLQKSPCYELSNI